MHFCHSLSSTSSVSLPPQAARLYMTYVHESCRRTVEHHLSQTLINDCCCITINFMVCACVSFLQTIGFVIHRATLRHSVTAVIHLFPVLRQLRAVKPEFEKVLEVRLAKPVSCCWKCYVRYRTWTDSFSSNFLVFTVHIIFASVVRIFTTCQFQIVLNKFCLFIFNLSWNK